MDTGLRFSLEIVEGDRLGRLVIPYSQVAQWITFLASPHYRAQIIAAEQDSHAVTIYFEADEGLYGYLHDRTSIDTREHQESPSWALAS